MAECSVTLRDIQQRAAALLRKSAREEYLDTGEVLDFLNDIKATKKCTSRRAKGPRPKRR